MSYKSCIYAFSPCILCRPEFGQLRTVGADYQGQSSMSAATNSTGKCEGCNQKVSISTVSKFLQIKKWYSSIFNLHVSEIASSSPKKTYRKIMLAELRWCRGDFEYKSWDAGFPSCVLQENDHFEYYWFELEVILSRLWVDFEVFLSRCCIFVLLLEETCVLSLTRIDHILSRFWIETLGCWITTWHDFFSKCSFFGEGWTSMQEAVCEFWKAVELILVSLWAQKLCRKSAMFFFLDRKSVV